jgi:hypothetical protein
MDPTISANLPIVIQQAGDVSRVQDVMQRLPQVHQAAAAAEGAEDQARRQEQVQRSEQPDVGNQVRADQGGGGAEQQRQGLPRRRPQPAPAEEPPARPRPPHDGVVDVIV